MNPKPKAMSNELKSDVLVSLARMARTFSGASVVRPESRLHADLGLGGGDFIEFIEEVERAYGVSLEEVSPHGHGVAADVTVAEVAEVILRKRANN
jgi:hypothetical protein